MRIAGLRISFLGLLSVLTIGCGGGDSGAMPPPVAPACVPAVQPAFAYVVDGATTSTVSMFTIDSCTGALTATTPATVATGILPESMVVDPGGKFAYVANRVSNASDQATISMYAINPNSGVLTPTTPATIPTGFYPQGIGIDPSSKFVYTANSDSNTVSMFTISAATGVLTPTSPATVATGGGPLSVTIHPSGKFAYAANQDDDTISMYTVNTSTGVLVPMTPATVLTGSSPFGVTVDPSGKFAYVPNAYDPNNSVSQYTVDPLTGVLSPNTMITATAGTQPTSVAVDPSSKFAYVVNRVDNTVSMFAIDASNGNLMPNGTIATGVEPFRIVIDPSGKFAYVANENGGTVSIYTLNGNGTLSAAGETVTGVSAVSLAVTGVAQ